MFFCYQLTRPETEATYASRNSQNVFHSLNIFTGTALHSEEKAKKMEKIQGKETGEKQRNGKATE